MVEGSAGLQQEKVETHHLIGDAEEKPIVHSKRGPLM